MNFKVVRANEPEDIPVPRMKDGDVGEIITWGVGESESAYVGTSVHRYGNILVSIGKSAEHAWKALLDDSPEGHTDCRVRLLKPGDAIVKQED